MYPLYKSYRNVQVTVLFIIIAFSQAYSAYRVNPDDSAKIVEKNVSRVYNVSRLSTDKPVTDGVLNDACWKTGEWAGDFTQWIPNEGANPSSPTYIKILYDDKNLYVAVRAVDNEPEKISCKAGRRDQFTGDIVGICLDSYFDHRTGFEFDVTASGQKIDLVLTNPMNGDNNWNAVWIGKSGMEDSAWVVEFEIPLSQLRYSSDYEQVWGMHFWRWIDRLQEESDWEPQSSTGPGMLYQFGELHGIKGLPKSRRIEIMPYTLGKLKTFKKERDNPFADNGRSWLGNAGLDAKIGLASNFTADITVNPDFGQVEADPSEMNLTAFETFFDEKRPFFLEGKNIFSFDFDNSGIFYSRRIGHLPSYSPELNDDEYMKYPDNNTILSAVKLSGKTSKGLSVGVLQSLTANGFARIDSAGIKSRMNVEPLTNYAIVRVQQDFKQGNTVIGGILTSTNRFVNNLYLDFLNREAYTGGLDLLHQWHDKEFYIDAKFTGSIIKGSTDAITALQRSSARYYQRPDISYIYLDTTRTGLSGYGGSVKIGKGSKGLWRYSTELNWRSPGLDLNDLGFMQMADIITQGNSLSYFVNHPVSIFRTYSVGITETNDLDFGMRYLSSEVNLDIYLEFINKWAVNISTEYTSQSLDTRILRGGYAMLLPAAWYNYLYIKTDPSAGIFFDLTTDLTVSDNKSSRTYSIKPGLSVTPVDILKISLSLDYSDNLNNLQYVDTKTVTNQNRYILGKIEQQTLGMTFRVDYNISPEISIQYYGSPFVSVGKYSEFKQVTNPNANNYNDRYMLLDPILNGDNYEVSENNNILIDYTFQNPDFNFSQFRSNLVFRWEYRPGSQIYLVWSHERTRFVSPENGLVNDAMGKLTSIFPDNIFLVKLNYWFSL